MKLFSLLKILKKITLSTLVVTIIFLSGATPAHAQTQAWSGVCVGAEKINPTTDANDVATIQGLQCLIGNVFTVILGVIGLAGFLMFIIGSFRYLLSGGNSKGTETAKHTFTYAVIGLVVALSGFILINLLATFTGIHLLTRFSIPSSDWGLSGGPNTFPDARNN